MLVKELKELLESVDESRLVILASDVEGNEYSPLENIDSSSLYEAKNSYSGYVSIEELTPELIKRGFIEEDIIDGGLPAVILWPTN